MSNQPENPADVIKATLDEQLARIRTALENANLSHVARETGLHENTVRNISKGRGEMPTLATIQKLGKFLFG